MIEKQQKNMILSNSSLETAMVYMRLTSRIYKTNEIQISSMTNVSTYHIPDYYASTDDVLYANTTYYTDNPNIHADNARDLVRFFHEAWGHPDKITMINIVKHKLLLNIPAALTESMINKHFPIKCSACPIGNLSKRPLHQNYEEHKQRLLNPPAKGSEVELDIQGPWTDAKGKC